MKRAIDRLAAQASDCIEGPFPSLPKPPLLGFRDICLIEPFGGRYGRGVAEATIDLSHFAWVFSCHFANDPVLPGTMLVDGLLQLAGFFGGCAGLRGRGRALLVGASRFVDEVTPADSQLTYKVNVSCLSKSRQVVVADGEVSVDGRLCASAASMWVHIKR